jgi:hypothetical protein
MGRMLDTVERFFESEKWQFTRDDELPMLITIFSGENGKWACYAHIREEQEQFVFYSICPMSATEDTMAAVAEFAARANSGLIIGNFELDYSDGQIGFKTAVDVEGAALTPALVQRLVHTNVVTMDRYLPGIVSVILGHNSPDDAVAAVLSQGAAY